MRVKNTITLLILLFSITSCVEKYWPEINKYDNVIVVDGLLTNGDEPTIVKLSTSVSVNSVDVIPISGGELYISDENKVETHLTEIEPGTYQVLDNSFRGQVGNSYQLHIELPNGQSYKSDICRLAAPSPIDSVYGLIENPLYPNSNEESYGYQFYINNHTDSDDTSYYLWKLSQTYEYRSTFDIHFTWDGAMVPFPNPDSLRTCWRTTNVNKIFTHSTKHLNPPIITEFPLNFVSTKTKMLSIRYSLLVKQLSISEEAFNYWDALSQQNNDQGDLYTQQPIQIVGNIHPVNITNEPVLGYFTIAGVTEKRIFVPRPVLTFYYDICEPDSENVGYVLNGSSELWPVYLTNVPNVGLAIAAQDVCFDCRMEGGSLTPPDFWEE